MSIQDAKAMVRSFGMTIRRTEFGEYRVNYVGGNEQTAYYTNDLSDAVATARHMAAEAA